MLRIPGEKLFRVYYKVCVTFNGSQAFCSCPSYWSCRRAILLRSGKVKPSCNYMNRIKSVLKSCTAGGVCLETGARIPLGGLLLCAVGRPTEASVGPSRHPHSSPVSFAKLASLGKAGRRMLAPSRLLTELQLWKKRLFGHSWSPNPFLHLDLNLL